MPLSTLGGIVDTKSLVDSQSMVNVPANELVVVVANVPDSVTAVLKCRLYVFIVKTGVVPLSATSSSCGSKLLSKPLIKTKRAPLPPAVSFAELETILILCAVDC